ncbi:MAG: hypothetical protein MOP51_105 [Citricoccus sp.]|jgi:hypothetical protein|nr:hypothetical protein [Citricoccus sp. WCRC_4]
MDTEAVQDSQRHPRGHRGKVGHSAGYAHMAPSVERGWVEDFVLEHRLLGVPGDRIGDALALIESHVAESGEPVREAFGDARAYARESAPADRVGGARNPGWLPGVGFGLAGMLLTSSGANEWLFGAGALEITPGVLLTGLLVLVAFGVLVLAPGAVLRLAVERTWVFAGILLAFTAVLVVLALVLDVSLAVWPAGPVVSAGIVLLVLGAVFTWVDQARGLSDDPIIGPPQQPGAADERPGAARGAAARWLPVVQFPVLTLLVIGLGWVLHVLA